MTDNGPAYRSAAHGLACKAMGIKHIRIQRLRELTGNNVAGIYT